MAAGSGRVYVLGFVFSADHKRVLLYQKAADSPLHPGMWNGVGGKIEAGEKPKQAMERESIEEIGLSGMWIRYGELYGTGFYVHLFRAHFPENPMALLTTSGPVQIVNVADLTTFDLPIVPNLPMLIGAALGHARPELWQGKTAPSHSIREVQEGK